MRAIPALLLAATAAFCVSSPVLPATPSLPAAGAFPADVVRTLAEFLLTPGLELSKLPGAQERFFTPTLLTEFRDTQSVTEGMAAAHPTVRIDVPDNNTLLMSWDAPSAVEIVEARIDGSKALVEANHRWGAETNYPGTVQKTVYELLFVQSAWKLNEIYAYPSEYGYKKITRMTDNLRSLRTQWVETPNTSPERTREK